MPHVTVNFVFPKNIIDFCFFVCLFVFFFFGASFNKNQFPIWYPLNQFIYDSGPTKICLMILTLVWECSKPCQLSLLLKQVSLTTFHPYPPNPKHLSIIMGTHFYFYIFFVYHNLYIEFSIYLKISPIHLISRRH